MRQHSAGQAPLTPSCPSRAEFGQRLRQSLSKFARKKRMFPASECLESSVVVLRTAVYPALAPLPFSYSSSCSLLTNKGVEFVLTLFRLLRQPANGSKNMSGPAQKWVALGVGVKLLELQEGGRVEGTDMWLTLARVAALKCSARAASAPTESTAPVRNILPADNCVCNMFISQGHNVAKQRCLRCW